MPGLGVFQIELPPASTSQQARINPNDSNYLDKIQYVDKNGNIQDGYPSHYQTPWAANFDPLRPYARPCVDLRHTYIYDSQNYGVDTYGKTSSDYQGNKLGATIVHPQLKPSKYFKFSVHVLGNPIKDTTQICFMRMYGKIHHNIILPTENEWISGGIQPKGQFTYDHRLWNTSDGRRRHSYHAVNLVGKKLKNNY